MDRYFGKTSYQKRDIIPIWTSFVKNPYKNVVSMRPPFAGDKILIVFGGQLVAGRGVGTLLDAITKARSINPNIMLLVCGSGDLSENVVSFSNKYPESCKYLGKLSRKEYLKLLSYSDIGVVATVEGVESPSYPSKSLDYMASGMAMVASIESSSDFGTIITSNGIGLSCRAGDITGLSNIIVKLSLDAGLRSSMGQRGLSFVRENHFVSNVADKILRF